MLAPADDDARMLRRTSAATSFWRLYQSDGLFRSSLDFTVIGLVVYWFVAPLPLPSLDWLKSTGASNPAGAGNQAAGTGTSPSASPITPADIAQAATPTRPKKLADKVRREWFKLSDPAIVPGLHKVADLIDNGAGAAEARAALDEIGRPDDLNVAYLSALAHLVSREKGASQRAYEEHLRAANAGHPAAMDQVGQLLRLGEGVKLDLAAAVEWYERGAAAGSAAAAANAGRAYVNGWARPIDHVKAMHYYRQAAEAGDLWGMHNYGGLLVNGARGIPRDAVAGREWIEKAALAGLPTAQHSMATLTRKGIGGPRDLDAFLKWAQAAAGQGMVLAIYDLGMFHLKPDDDRPADPARAANYLRQAAIKKHPAAQFAYATLCERGVGVPVNAVQAFVYYSLALRAGEAEAQGRLDALRNRMAGQELETAQKLVAAASS